MTIGEVIRRTTEHLESRGSETPRLDAELLLGKALGLERIELYMHLDRPLVEDELTRARELVSRRARREPLQYILGEWGFRRLTLRVDSRALIPRPETEMLVERALALIAGSDAPRVLDVGTGSGAIALALADEHPGADVTGIDVSQDALALAAENVELTGLAVTLAQGDLRTGLPPGPWDLVVSNPPYVHEIDRNALPPEVRDYEPELALYGEGVHAMLVAAAVRVLAPRGAIAVEVGDGQAAGVATLFEESGLHQVAVSNDLAGRERVVEGRRDA
jgi:release factor glutamine methyltransferase